MGRKCLEAIAINSVFVFLADSAVSCLVQWLQTLTLSCLLTQTHHSDNHHGAQHRNADCIYPA